MCPKSSGGAALRAADGMPGNALTVPEGHATIIYFPMRKLLITGSAAETQDPGIRQTQAQRVSDALRGQIVRCELAPGVKLNITALVDSHQASLGAVREALAMLEREGFVVFEPQKGYGVRPVSSADLVDLTFARIQIEKACVASSLENGDLEWESALVASYHLTLRLNRSREGIFNHADPRWIAAHGGFHAALVAACESRRLLATRELLYVQSERYRHLSTLFSVERDVDAEHARLLQAALDRDIPAAQALVATHIRSTAEALIDANFPQPTVPTRRST